MSLGLQAALWGSFVGAALIIGAIVGYYCSLSQRVVAGFMAFGSGVLIAALSFDLVYHAYSLSGIYPTVFGFLIGVGFYSAANYIVCHFGGRNRKRSNINQDPELEHSFNNSKAIAAGSLIDGIPEAMVIGISMVLGGTVSIVMVVSVFVSNIPEGLSSAAGMKNGGKKFSYPLIIFGTISLLCAISSCLGFLLFENASLNTVGWLLAIAGGTILAMIVDTMIPEAFAKTHNWAGLITAIGFLCVFVLETLTW